MILKNLIYIFQREDYYIARFLKFSYSNFFWHRLQKRNKLKWTKKTISLFALSFLLFLILFFLILASRKYFLFLGLYFSLPILIVFSFLILRPFDFYLKKKIVEKARKVLEDIKKRKEIIVIGISGSFGKTSQKEILAKILESKFKVLKISGNINTELGVSEFILNHQSQIEEVGVFVVEMGAYKMGEIGKICDLVKPQFSILTGIGNCHLERFGNLENLIKAKFELAEKTTGLAFLNIGNDVIANNFKNYNIKKSKLIDIKDVIKNIEHLDNFSGLRFEYNNFKLETKLLATHNIDLIVLAISLAQELGIDMEAIKKSLSSVEIVKHRLEPIYNANTKIWVIDDSYNGNFSGIKSGLEVLNLAKGRKIVLTPGLVELGEESKKVHTQIAQIYRDNVDLVLLIDTKATKIIKKNFVKNNFRNYKIYKSSKEAHDDLANILKTEDTIIFQNDISDNYL